MFVNIHENIYLARPNVCPLINVLREPVNFQLSDVVQTIFKRPIGIADYTNICQSPHSDYVTRCYNVLSREVITAGSLKHLHGHFKIENERTAM